MLEARDNMGKRVSIVGFLAAVGMCFVLQARAASADTSTEASPGTPGVAWFAVDGGGLVKLEDRKFTVVTREPARFKQLALAVDGTLWILGSGGAYRLAGGGAEKIGDYRNPGTLNCITAASDGTLWAAGQKGVHHFDGKTWSTEDRSLLGPEAELLRAIAVDRAGTVWVASATALHRRDAGAWKTIETSAIHQSKKVYYGELAAEAGGKLYATHTGGVLELAGDSLRALDLGQRYVGSLDLLRIAPDGRLHAKKNRGELFIVSPQGGIEELSSTKGSFGATAIEALAVDGSGRTWMGTDNGVVIVEPGGRAVEWVTGSVPELTGKIQDIAVAGPGPELPMEVVSEVAKGNVSGKLLRDGAPVADAEVEICRSPRMMFHGTPCAEAPFHQRTTSDTQGTFTFTGVPLGAYQFAILDGDKWVLASAECCRNIKENQLYDVGSINLSR